MGGSRERSTSRGEKKEEKKKRARSDSESGTPDWLKSRRERAAKGELPRENDRGGKGKGRDDDRDGGGKGGGKEQRPGDWTCSGCGGANFARRPRTECFKCNGNTRQQHRLQQVHWGPGQNASSAMR
ncbi:unnamed protein product [Polarella glacialis]|uniref:RanBP2-type domain-containing protein n=1 Tax=Polarella glacialis TaxID=89957 RepID=A0A813FM97_POLGL|nr:unnamed protein product [Polarella glacialis]